MESSINQIPDKNDQASPESIEETKLLEEMASEQERGIKKLTLAHAEMVSKREDEKSLLRLEEQLKQA